MALPPFRKGSERMGHPRAVRLVSLLIERASGVLAIALDFDFLFALRVSAVVAAILLVLRNYTLALRVAALLVLVSHGHFPFFL